MLTGYSDDGVPFLRHTNNDRAWGILTLQLALPVESHLSMHPWLSYYQDIARLQYIVDYDYRPLVALSDCGGR